MSFLTIGDLAQSLAARRGMARLSGDLFRLSGELSTGRRDYANLSGRTEIGPLAVLEADIARLDGQLATAQEQVTLGQATQAALGRMASLSGHLVQALMLSPDAAPSAMVDLAAAEARRGFESAVAALNTQVAGLSLFAGTGVDAVPLPDAAGILAGLEAAIGTPPDAATAAVAIETYFAPGGPFETVDYRGQADARADISLNGARISPPGAEAIAPEIAATLSAMAKAALVDRGLFDGASVERAALVRDAGEALLSAEAGLAGLRAGIGRAEEQLSRAMETAAAERAAFDMAKLAMVEADPFETASRLRDAEARLEALYTVTGRLADLTLTRYLR